MRPPRENLDSLQCHAWSDDMPGRRILDILLFAVGISVFLVRLQHLGPYVFPEQENLRVALLALALGA